MNIQLDPDRDFVVHLPYNLTLNEVKLDPNVGDPDLEDEIEWLYLNAGPEEMKRIMTSTVVLHNVVVPTPSIAQCLATAIVWERG